MCRETIINGEKQNLFNTELPSIASIVSESPYHMLMRGNGRTISNSKTLTTGAGANNYVNIFSFTGPFKIFLLIAILTDVTDITDFEDVGFGLWDGTNITQLTLRNPGGAILDGYGAYSALIMTEDVTNAITAMNSDQVRISQASRTPYQEAYVTPKYGVTNYLRLAYDSSSINVGINVGLIYSESPQYASGLVAV